MYTSYIGKKFVDLYSQRTGENLSARAFFEQHVYELFYNHKKYFKWVVNSPLVQNFGKKERPRSFTEGQNTRLRKLIHKIEHDTVDSHFAIGFPTASIDEDTSGQVSTVQTPSEMQDLFASWIGAGFGLEVNGGQVWLINDDEVLWTIFEGWKKYREFLNSDAFNLKGNDIDAWNTAWLQFTFDQNKISPKFMLSEYSDVITKGKLKGTYGLKRSSWIRLLFFLSVRFPGKEIIVYSSRYVSKKQKSETIGFIKLMLPQIKTFSDLFKTIIRKSKVVKSNVRLLDIYESEFGIERAAQFGVIGLRAIEPKNLRKYMSEGGSPTNEITNIIYKTWIIAMLQKQELLDSAIRVAEWLVDYQTNSSKATRNTRDQHARDFLSAKNREQILEALIKIAENDPSKGEFTQHIKDRIMLDIAKDDVRLFVYLIRIDYNALKSKK